MALITQSDSPVLVSPNRGVFAAATLAELKTFAAPVANQTVWVDGSATRGDGLGDTYWWNATDSRADNGTTIIASNLGGVGRWNLLTDDASHVTFTQSGAGAGARSVANKLGDVINISDRAGVDITGVLDSTAGLVAAEAARPSGSTLVWSGTLKISGAVTATQPGTWDMRGATINSAAGQLVINTSNFNILATDATLNYAAGSPASSLDRAVRILGSLSAVKALTGPIAVGATSFVDASASTVVAGDWIMVIENEVGVNYQRVEFKQVLSQVGSTINVTTPFAMTFSLFTQQWIKVLTPLINITIDGLTIVTSDAVNDNVGIDAQGGLIDFTIKNCNFDILKGLAWQCLYIHNPHIENNVIRRQIGRRSSVSTCHGGNVTKNKSWASTAIQTDGFLTVETGTSFLKVDHNQSFGAGGGAAVIYHSCGDYCVYDGNTLISGSSTIALYIGGGVGNHSTGNIFVNALTGIRYLKATSKAVSGNTSIGDLVRNATNGIEVDGTASNTTILDLDTDSTVTTPISDNGVNTVSTRRDPTLNGMIAKGPWQFNNAVSIATLNALKTNNPRTITASTDSAVATDTSLICNFAGTVTETFEAASTVPGKVMLVRTIQAQRMDSASANIVPLVGGAASGNLLTNTAGKWAIIQSDGTNYQIMAAN